MLPEIGRGRPAALVEYVGMLCVLAGLIVVFGMLTRHFLSKTTFEMIASQVPAATIAAVGMTFVLTIAGIDLSVGSVMALGGAMMGLAIVRWQMPLPLAIGACLAVGMLCGTLNGLVTVAWRLPSFIVTLGMLEVARGATMTVLGSRTVYIGSAVEGIADARIAYLPAPFAIALAAVAAGQIFLSRTVFGRHVVAVGSSEETARLCGVNVAAVKLKVFALCGLLAALAGVMQVSRAASANPNAGVGFELDT
ncbi:MAG: ABC transporter permease, partial [Planctomycetes bacterium]|nr:ABC transporter permease [Planctomycetota bacterium]